MRPAEERPRPARGESRERRPLLRSLRFAWDGLADGAVRDRNLRIHLALGVLAGAFVARAPLAPGERAVLLACVALVVAAEAMNSAVEAAVDLASPARSERARLAKDSAAAAVLALAAGSVLAFAAVAAARLDELRAAAARLGRGEALALAAGALAAACAAGVVAAPGRRPRGADLLLAAGGAAGIAVVAAGAECLAGVAAAALCLAVAAGGAARRPR
jgi:diacylglycerol kinase (ATP)